MNSYNTNNNTSCLDLKEIKLHLEDLGFEKQALDLLDCNRFILPGHSKVHNSLCKFMCGCRFWKFRKTCKLRICPTCSKKRSHKLYKDLREPFKKLKVAHSIYDTGLRFLTLTIKNTKNLEEGINDIQKFFRMFQRRKYILVNVHGGLGVIEAKRGKDRLWNVHVHCVIESKYLAREFNGEDPKLVKEWKSITKTSSVLDIRLVKDSDIALKYILKYVSKGLKDHSSEDIAEFYKATYGKRLLITFGSFRKILVKTKFLCPDCNCPLQYVSDYEYEELTKSKYPERPDKTGQLRLLEND